MSAADVAESADALASGASEGNFVGVQVPSSAPTEKVAPIQRLFFCPNTAACDASDLSPAVEFSREDPQKQRSAGQFFITKNKGPSCQRYLIAV